MIAGPNGSGKSTLTEWVDFEGRTLLLDPDAIARAMSPSDPRGAAIPAGREVLRRIDAYLESGDSFAVETTLSSHASLGLIGRARSRGYEIHLTFVALDSPEQCIARIGIRALRGGHSIPDVDVRRRYFRSIANLAEAVRAADVAKLYDNSGDEHRLVLAVRSGVVISLSDDLPLWIREVSEDLRARCLPALSSPTALLNTVWRPRHRHLSDMPTIRPIEPAIGKMAGPSPVRIFT